MPYDEYSKPDIVVKQKPMKHMETEQLQQQRASENQKLLEDALDDLSDEEPPPPVSEQKSTSSESESDEDAKGKNLSPRVSKIWPPPPAAEQQERPVEIKTTRAGASVLSKWQVAVAEEKTETKPAERPKARGLSKKWPPDPTEKEETEVSLKWPPAPKPAEESHVEPPEPKPTPPPPTEPEPEEKLPALAVRLRPIQQQEAPSKQLETQTMEIGKIHLKKAANKQVSVHCALSASFQH